MKSYDSIKGQGHDERSSVVKRGVVQIFQSKTMLTEAYAIN